MGKNKKNRAAATNQIQHKNQTSAEAFSFGDPVPVCSTSPPRCSAVSITLTAVMQASSCT